MHILKNTNFNFVRWRWHALLLSWVIVLAGAAFVWMKGMPLGVEFSGGTIVVVGFDTVPGTEEIRTALDAAMPGVGQTAVVQRYGDAAARQMMIRVPSVGAESGANLSETAEKVMAALKTANLAPHEPPVGTEIVGPSVGEQLTRRGILATVLALAGILIYVALRFQFSFAVGAVVATVHDLLITFAFLAFFRYDLSLNVIAALLTITGYSVNDTIVIFDRVRENLRSHRRDSLEQVVNTAVNQTLGRTIITAGTTLLSVIALYLFGGEVLQGFAFTMLVGVITGTYSSVFIASGIVLLWQGRKASRAQVTAATTPAAPAVPAKDAPRKPRRRRVS